MLSTTIIMAAVALIAGYADARWQKKRQSNITKREAIELRLKLNESMKMSRYVLAAFEDHHDVHKVLNHHIEVLSHNMSIASRVIGLKQSGASRSLS